MNPKMPRPATLGGANRAVNSKELGGTFDPEFSEEGREPQDSVVSNAPARIVLGRRGSFLYIRSCPLCGLEHAHGFFGHGQGSDPLTAFAWHSGVHVAHCHCQGPGRVARSTRGGWRTVVVPPAEWREPSGYEYRLVLFEPACFTPLGIQSKDARLAMAELARRGAATSLEILRPRRGFILWRGDK
jgi:hypothetical protein